MIARCLGKKSINRIYEGKNVKRDNNDAITVGKDYVIISIEIENKEESSDIEPMRYWIIDDNYVLMPYDIHNFKIIDNYISKLWVVQVSQNSLTIGAENLGKQGYICDYFDYEETEKEYNNIIKKIFKESILAGQKKNIKLKLGISNIDSLI